MRGTVLAHLAADLSFDMKALHRILVADDDEVMRQAIALTLRRAGYIVDLAEDGWRCLDLYRSAAADLVVMDIYMPEKDGLETIIALRKEFPQAAVIAMSGSRGSMISQLVLQAAQGLGAVRTIEKPFTPEALLALVAEELERIRAAAGGREAA
jgi:two-component system, chemotaxis family, chemotaxis protein CheY